MYKHTRIPFVPPSHVHQQDMYTYARACSQKYDTHTLTQYSHNKSEVLTVSETQAGKQTEEKNLPRGRWQNEIDSQTQLREIGGGSAVKKASFVSS